MACNLLRDIAEDDETDLDRDSIHPIHEQTHNSKNQNFHFRWTEWLHAITTNNFFKILEGFH